MAAKFLQARSVSVRPVSVAGTDRFHRLFELGQFGVLPYADQHDWTNFSRSDDYVATVYFYFGRPTSNLPSPCATARSFLTRFSAL